MTFSLLIYLSVFWFSALSKWWLTFQFSLKFIRFQMKNKNKILWLWLRNCLHNKLCQLETFSLKKKTFALYFHLLLKNCFSWKSLREISLHRYQKQYGQMKRTTIPIMNEMCWTPGKFIWVWLCHLITVTKYIHTRLADLSVFVSSGENH